jgi:hypothetical protein
MHNIVRVDGLSGTVAALLCCGVRSPCTVACRLRMSDRSASYCCLPTTLISCTYLMPVIRCVWPVTYAFNAPPAPCARWGHDEPDARHLGNARARPGAASHWAHGGSGALLHQVVCLEHQDTWWYWSPTGWWSWCFGNMVTSEPFRVGGGPGAARHVVTLEPSPTGWRARCLEHVATLETFPDEWRALCYGARGDTEALFLRVACSVPQGT